MAYESMSFAVGYTAEYGGIQNTLFQVQKKLDKTMERLSTGKRINDMKDDEGGKAISDVMSSWKKGTDESIHNLKEFITMTKVAEKALNDIQDILFEMKQTVDRLNGIEEGTSRSAAQAQLTELAMAINKIAMHTEYKGFKLFNLADSTTTTKQAYLYHSAKTEKIGTGAGVVSHSDRYIRYGAGAEDFLAWDLGMDPRAQQLGMVMRAEIGVSTADGVDKSLQKLYLNGKSIDEIATEQGLDLTSEEGIATAIREALGENVKVDFVKNSDGTVIRKIILQTPGDFVYSIKNTSNNILTTGVIRSVKFVTYEREFSEKTTGYQYRLEGNAATISLTGGTSTDDQNINSGTTIDVEYTGVIGNRQYAVYHPNADGDDTVDSDNTASAGGEVTAQEGLFDINVMTQENAAVARVQIEAAINQINELRGVLAAMQHQAEALINQRMEESVAAEEQISHIMDTDYAKELAEFTRQQIAQQAGVNMLAQKRQMAQLITQLLR
jgi:flagellin